MMATATRILTRDDVARLLTMKDCIEAVESAFRRHGEGSVPAPALMSVHAPGDAGGFHTKAALYPDGSGRWCFVTKTNGNFPSNPERTGLPTIQGLILISDAEDGRVLAVMDSIEVTTQRTAAASAVAARWLSRSGSTTLAILGCGVQGRAHVEALSAVRPIERVVFWDRDESRALALARQAETVMGVRAGVAGSARSAARDAELIATCTPSREPLLGPGDVAAGSFIAAVGADNGQKWEIAPALMSESRVIVDVLEQCAAIGDLHHAIESGAMRPADVAGDLGGVVAGRIDGRANGSDVVIYDSTGMALQDAAAAIVVYERAQRSGAGLEVEFNGRAGRSAG